MNAEDIDGIVDFHVHLPWRYRDPVQAARRLVAAMDEAGVQVAVVIAVEAGVETFRRNTSRREVKRALEEVADYIMLGRVPGIQRLLYNTGEALREHEDLIREHRRTTEEVVEAARAYPDRLLPVGSFCPDRGVEDTLRRLRRFEDELLGVKIYPTLHYVRPNDRRLEPLYRWAEESGKIVIVHTGCDPGLWELPRMCRYARPKYVAEAARRHRDAVFIVAHMGSYSAIMPGIFFHEALEAASLDNVYLDTSAVDPFFVDLAVEKIGYDKLLFGSDYPYMVGLTIKDVVMDILRLDIPVEAKRAILRDNAVRLLKRLGRLPKRLE